GLDQRPGDLLEWYIRIYIAELKSLLAQGLLHTYEAKEENLPVLKGKLQFAQHLQRNNIHKERFFVRHHQRTDHHPANLRIGAAIRQLQLLPLRSDLQAELNYLKRFFPQPDETTNALIFLPPVNLQDRRLARYVPALEITDHILQRHLPDVRAGMHHGLALLFAMNALFEEYLYRQ